MIDDQRAGARQSTTMALPWERVSGPNVWEDGAGSEVVVGWEPVVLQPAQPALGIGVSPRSIATKMSCRMSIPSSICASPKALKPSVIR